MAEGYRADDEAMVEQDDISRCIPLQAPLPGEGEDAFGGFRRASDSFPGVRRKSFIAVQHFGQLGGMAENDSPLPNGVGRDEEQFDGQRIKHGGDRRRYRSNNFFIMKLVMTP